MKRIILLTAVACLFAVNAFAGEFWINPSLEENGVGTELSPYNSIDPIPTDRQHTLHLIGVPGYKYQGGFGGFSLLRCDYGRCDIKKHEDDALVTFSPTRSILVSKFSDGPDGTKTLRIHPRFKMRGKRFYYDPDTQTLNLTRPIYLGKEQMKGFQWDRETHTLTMRPGLVMGKVAHKTRRDKLRQMKADYLAAKNAIAEVAANPDLLDEIEVPK